MGGDHDLMDPISHHGARGVAPVRSEKPSTSPLGHGGVRFRSRTTREWWHYTLDAEPYPDTYFDFPIA